MHRHIVNRALLLIPTLVGAAAVVFVLPEREVTRVSTWTEDDKRIATRALKTLEEASVASRGAAIYYLEPVRREMGIKRPDDIPERSDAWRSVPPLRGASETG